MSGHVGVVLYPGSPSPAISAVGGAVGMLLLPLCICADPEAARHLRLVGVVLYPGAPSPAISAVGGAVGMLLLPLCICADPEAARLLRLVGVVLYPGSPSPAISAVPLLALSQIGRAHV